MARGAYPALDSCLPVRGKTESEPQFWGNVRKHDFFLTRVAMAVIQGPGWNWPRLASPAAAPGPLLILGELTCLLDGTQSEAEPELTNARRDGASWGRPG